MDMVGDILYIFHIHMKRPKQTISQVEKLKRQSTQRYDFNMSSWLISK